MTVRGETSTRERRLVLRNDLTELDRLGAFARDIGHDEGLDADRLFALELCLEEAVANIIMHGGAGGRGGKKQITVALVHGAPSLAVSIEDDGRPFDPTAVPPPAIPASLADARVGGMGVHLIRKMTTDMHYERVGERNRLTLIFGRRAEG
jgi:anti-sigma regulatory factor (Ser/Thr protein kinase)